MEYSNIKLESVVEPKKDCAFPVMLTDETMRARRERVLLKMRENHLDKLVIYCDVEHSGNFNYLVGFFTRFEEALLVMDKSGEMTLLLGNENLNKAEKARCKCKAIHVSLFSLPNQPNREDRTLKELLMEAGIAPDQHIGIVGWKNFTSPLENQTSMLDIPCYIVDVLREIVQDPARLVNATWLFIGESGVRTINNANEIAHYEYGAALASDCMLDAMNHLVPGVSELEIGDMLVRQGQHTSVVTIAAFGERFVKANMFPSGRKLQVGDPVSLTVGYAGGSSSRAGYAVSDESELPENAKIYIEALARPYFAAYTTWLSEIKIGMTGGRLFDRIEQILPRKKYHWSLCPGHLTAEEEWLSSPVYENSQEMLKSGMIFQIDIIPSQKGMAGTSAESTVVLADAALKSAIQSEYPEMWERMQQRRKYLKEELGIPLSDDVLPMCATVAYLRPFLLDQTHAFRVASR